jgi:hypothetical protein
VHTLTRKSEKRSHKLSLGFVALISGRGKAYTHDENLVFAPFFASFCAAASHHFVFHFLEKNPCEIIFNKAVFAGFDLK